MAEISKETITTQGNNINPVVNTTTKDISVKSTATSSQTVEYLVYFFFGVLEILLAFRLILKLTGASISSAFVGLIYGLTGVFILPFEGIFRRGFAQGVETTSVLEPSTLVAIIVYAVLAWGIVKLLRILSGEQQKTE
ncbi:MAG: YggT family protein [Candidatus Gottesmanbacteria bacterium]